MTAAITDASRTISRAPVDWGRRTIGAGIIGGLATASGIALTATSGWLIVRAAERPVILTLLTAIVAVRAFGMARPVFRYWERLVSHDASLATLAARRSAAYDRLIPLTPARLGRRRRSDVLTAVVHDLSDEVDAQVRVTVPVLSSAVAGGIAIALTSALAPQVGLVLGVVAVAVVAISLVTLRIESSTLTALLAARAEVVRVSELVTSQASELLAVGGWNSALGWLDEAHAAVARATRRAVHGRALGAGCFLLVVGAATVATASIATGLDVSTPVKALLVLTPVAVSDAITPLADAMRAKAQASGAAMRTRRLLTQDPAVHDPTAPRQPNAVFGLEDGVTTDRSRPKTAFGGLALSGITASWRIDPSGPNAEPHAVHEDPRQPQSLDLGPTDLELPAGTSVAIVGPNGSGKSTLLAVIARQLDPVAGSYVVEGRAVDSSSTQILADVLAEPLEQARSRIAVVDDETHVFATTLRGNLVLARDDATDDEVHAALDRAGLGRFVADLLDGLDTVLGAGGRGVSGGERARLGIARALLSERPVILLDEPVAHLDPPTALAVVTDLLAPGDGHRDDACSESRTVVMVTHRPEGLELVDHVVELSYPHR